MKRGMIYIVFALSLLAPHAAFADWGYYSCRDSCSSNGFGCVLRCMTGYDAAPAYYENRNTYDNRNPAAVWPYNSYVPLIKPHYNSPHTNSRFIYTTPETGGYVAPPNIVYPNPNRSTARNFAPSRPYNSGYYNGRGR